ncbi:MAG: hypothetical protein V3T08_10025 [Gemmatimonadota bacterium]
MSGSTEWFVDVWEGALDMPPVRPAGVCHTLGPFSSEGLAERAERGVLCNLREDCWTEIREESPSG